MLPQALSRRGNDPDAVHCRRCRLNSGAPVGKIQLWPDLPVSRDQLSGNCPDNLCRTFSEPYTLKWSLSI